MEPTIAEFFAGQKILVTGASGFVGKVLVEKLLRCCPLLSKIYVIIRGKKSLSPAERWSDIVNLPLFDRLKEEYPEALNKIVVLEGDIAEKNLGLSEEDRRILESEVSIVFHSAASVRFDDSLKQAVLLNTRGAYETILLARRMIKLKCYVYVSTTYSNCNLDVPVIEEKVYPTEYNYGTIIQLVEKEDPVHLDLLTSTILGSHPNTYTFSKALAEQIMLENAKDMPIVIVRPSVVISSIYEPMSGWVDNMNGIFGITAGINKGVLRVYLARRNCNLDYVAVDYAINSLIVAAWHKSIHYKKKEKDLTVYNCAYGNIRKATFGDLVDYGMQMANNSPYTDVLWYPSITLTENLLLYNWLFFFLQIIPAILIDSILHLIGSKTM